MRDSVHVMLPGTLYILQLRLETVNFVLCILDLDLLMVDLTNEFRVAGLDIGE
jgi:hypothetical protein